MTGNRHGSVLGQLGDVGEMLQTRHANGTCNASCLH